MSLEELEARIEILEDIEAIKKLQATFCYVNDSFDWQRTVNLFADDAVAEYGPFGHYQGKEEIAQFCRDKLPKGISFLQHMLHNPVIEVRGNTATSVWYFETPVTQAPKPKAMWIAGKYNAEYAKINSEWKFKRLAVEFYYITPYEDGWVKTKMVQ